MGVLENSVFDVNSTSTPNSCTIDNAQRMGVQTTYWSIDADGNPEDYLDHTDSDFYEEQFYCSSCSDYFNSVNNLKEHLNG